MANNLKGLDANQVLRSVYDTATNSLRTTGGGGSGPIEVIIDQSTDSIRLGDGTNLITGTTYGSKTGLDVNIITPNVSTINKFNSINSVVANNETTIVSHTAIAGKQTFLQKISASGQNIAEYTIKKNSVPIERKRSYFGGSLNIEIDFEGILNKGELLVPGDIIEVTVLHLRPETANFDARLQLIEI